MATDVQATPKVKRFVCDTMMFGRFKRLFFVGIGGAGMSGIAEILHNLGYQIKGSDTTPSEVTDYLGKLGIQIAAEHKAVNVADSDVVVISSAVGESNPEVVEARRMGLPVIKRAEMLGELMRLKFAIGIAGTHGKTTTTSMVGRILNKASFNPTLIVGGVVTELGTGASLGEGDYMIAEVDEATLGIKRETITIIDTRHPGEGEPLQLSNFWVIEHGESKDLEIYVPRLYEDPTNLWTASTYRYTLTFVE